MYPEASSMYFCSEGNKTRCKMSFLFIYEETQE